MGQKAKAKKRARKARKNLANAAKAVAGLIAVYTASAIGAATSQSLARRARALTQPARERLARLWHRSDDGAEGAHA